MADAPFDLGETDRLLSTTRAVRRRLDLDRPVEPEVIEECLRLAIQAPTASNGQTWRFVVITDPDKRAAIAAVYSRLGDSLFPGLAQSAPTDQTKRVYEGAAALSTTLARVPVLVLACVEGQLDGVPVAMAASQYASILPAVWSFQLALRSRGLGSVLTTLHLVFAAEVAQILGIPEGYSQAALVPVAYTVGTDFKPAVRRPVEEITYWNAWGAVR